MSSGDREAFEVRAIGWVRGGRTEPVDDAWGAVTSTIELDGAQLDPEAVRGLAGFSHVEVVFVFDRVAEASVCRGARRPRGNPAWPEVGILAQRARDRPNRIGTTVCRLVAVDPGRLTVIGLDAVDGTPVVDVKPYLPGFGPRGDVRQPAWAEELMAGYW